MKKPKTEKRTIQGKECDYVKCPRCGIYVEEKTYTKHLNSPNCDRWLKNRDIRERATAKALGKLNSIL